MNDIVLKPSYVFGEVSVPSSKSVAHRVLVIAALSGKKIKIKNIDFSNDVYATIDALRQIGTAIEICNDYVEVDGSSLLKACEVHIDAKESGSTLRFMIPVATMLESKATFYGSGRLPERPLNDYFTIFDKFGVKYTHPLNKFLPLEVEGDMDFYEVDGKLYFGEFAPYKKEG